MFDGGWAGTEQRDWLGHPAGVLMALRIRAPRGGSGGGKSPGGGPWLSLCPAIPAGAAMPRRPLGTPMWPAGQGLGPAACRAGPKGLGEARPPNHSVQRGVAASGPPKARIWGWGGPPPWQGRASGGRCCLGTGWSVGQSGCCPRSQGERQRGYGDRVAQPLGQGVRAGAQSAEVQDRLQLQPGNKRRAER